MEDNARTTKLLSVFTRRGKINKYWFHILINACTVILGFSTFLPLSYVTSYFRGQCILYANVRLLPQTGSVIIVDIPETTWGQESDCEIPIYFSVVTTIHAFIWCWFFLMLIFQPSNEEQEIFLLDLSFMSHLVTWVLLLVSSSKLTGGTRHWCEDLTEELARPGISTNITTCSSTEHYDWNILEKKHRFYSFLVTANVCSWLLTVSVVCQSYWCAYRLFKWNDEGSDEEGPQSSSFAQTPVKYRGYQNYGSDDSL